MKREFQDDKGCISNILNRKIETIICIGGRYIDTTILNLFAIWLKLHDESCWHRIFLDAGLCFAEIYDECQKAYREDRENHSVYHLGDCFQLQDSIVTSATVKPLHTSGVKLEIMLDSEYAIYVWYKNINSNTNLSINIKK